MALRVLAAALLGAAAWQCAFVTSGSSQTRSPQVGVHANGQSAPVQAAEDAQDFTSPVMSLSAGMMVGLMIAVAGAAPVFAQNLGTIYDKPQGTENLLKELKVSVKDVKQQEKFYQGKKLDWRGYSPSDKPVFVKK